MKFVDVTVHMPEIAKGKIEDFAEQMGLDFNKAVEYIMTIGWKTICEKAREGGFTLDYGRNN